MFGRADLFVFFCLGSAAALGPGCTTSADDTAGPTGSSGAGGTSVGATTGSGGSAGAGGSSGAVIGSGGARSSGDVGGSAGSTGGVGAGGSLGGSGGNAGAKEAGGSGAGGGTADGGVVDDAARGTIDAGVADRAVDGGSDARARDANGNGMSFFVSSMVSTMGGNLGGLAGADARCQSLAAAVGAGDRTWHAYLSLSGPTPTNARDRIGNGPWYNVRGVMMADSVAHLHDEGGVMNALSFANTLDEKGATVRFANPDEHDVMTGSAVDGRALPATPDRTCGGWTLSSGGSVQVGHTDRNGGGERPTSWNSAHAVPSVPPLTTGGCALTDLQAAGGIGRIYCFAID